IEYLGGEAEVSRQFDGEAMNQINPILFKILVAVNPLLDPTKAAQMMSKVADDLANFNRTKRA
ncbi:MAG: hypothetical protein ABIP71_05900, partial [Verrucomicrobiota bacterium]